MYAEEMEAFFSSPLHGKIIPLEPVENRYTYKKKLGRGCEDDLAATPVTPLIARFALADLAG